MVGTMMNDVDCKRMVKGYGTKGKWHKARLEALEDPIIVANARWKSLPQLWSYMLCYSYV
jgi:hypothetical protein